MQSCMRLGLQILEQLAGARTMRANPIVHPSCLHSQMPLCLKLSAMGCAAPFWDGAVCGQSQNMRTQRATPLVSCPAGKLKWGMPKPAGKGVVPPTPFMYSSAPAWDDGSDVFGYPGPRISTFAFCAEVAMVAVNATYQPASLPVNPAHASFESAVRAGVRGYGTEAYYMGSLPPFLTKWSWPGDKAFPAVRAEDAVPFARAGMRWVPHSGHASMELAAQGQ